MKSKYAKRGMLLLVLVSLNISVFIVVVQDAYASYTDPSDGHHELNRRQGNRGGCS